MMQWYEFIFIGALIPFGIILIGASIASVVFAYNVAVFLIQGARGKL